MNQVFDFSRFRLLMARHWMENRQRYLLSLGAIAGILVLWFIFIFLMEGCEEAADVDVQRSTFFTILIITGCLFASTMFTPLSSKSKGINYLSVPASQFEKLLVAILYAVVIFFLCYTIIFYAVDFLMLQIMNPIAKSNWQPADPAHLFQPEPLANVFMLEKLNYSSPQNEVPVLIYLLLSYFALQSAFLAGSVFFRKFCFIKTFIALLLLGFIYWLLMYLFFTAILPEGSFMNGQLDLFAVRTDTGLARINIPSWLINGGKFFFLYGFPPLLWLATLKRLNEKEI